MGRETGKDEGRNRVCEQWGSSVKFFLNCIGLTDLRVRLHEMSSAKNRFITKILNKLKS